MKPENLVVCPEPGCNSTTFLIDANDGSIVCAVCGKQIGIMINR